MVGKLISINFKIGCHVFIKLNQLYFIKYQPSHANMNFSDLIFKLFWNPFNDLFLFMTLHTLIYDKEIMFSDYFSKLKLSFDL